MRKATDLRRAKTTIGRAAGIKSDQLSKAMLHSKTTANQYYDDNPLENVASLHSDLVRVIDLDAGNQINAEPGPSTSQQQDEIPPQSVAIQKGIPSNARIPETTQNESIVVSRFPGRSDAKRKRVIVKKLPVETTQEKLGYAEVKRRKTQCPECGKDQSSKNMSRHLRSHGYDDVSVKRFTSSTFKASNASQLEECNVCGALVTRLYRHLKIHQEPGPSYADVTNPEIEENVDDNDIDDTAMQLVESQLTAKYGRLTEFNKGDKYIYSDEQEYDRSQLLKYILAYHTSAFGKKKDSKSKAVELVKLCLNRRIQKLTVILQRLPTIRELLDADLFLNKEMSAEFKGSSKIKHCSDFISLGEAVLWNKRRFGGTDIGDYFSVISEAEVKEAQKEVNTAKSGFHSDTTGHKAS